MENSQENFVELFNKRSKELLEEGEDEFNKELNEFNNTHFESQTEALKFFLGIDEDYINSLAECKLVDIRKEKIKAKTYWDSLGEMK